MNNRNKNWFRGSILIIVALLILVSQFTPLKQWGTWNIFVALILIVVIVYSILRFNAFGIFIPLALLYSLFGDQIGLPVISIWILLLVAALLSIGTEMIVRGWFKNKHIYYMRHKNDGDQNNPHAYNNEVCDDDHPSISLSFTESIKYLQAKALQYGDISVSFGSLKIYMDKVALSPNDANINLNCHFGSLQIFIPRTWKLIDNIQATLGSVTNNTLMHQNETKADSPCLTLNGKVDFGEIEINYL